MSEETIVDFIVPVNNDINEFIIKIEDEDTEDTDDNEDNDDDDDVDPFMMNIINDSIDLADVYFGGNGEDDSDDTDSIIPLPIYDITGGDENDDKDYDLEEYFM